MKTKKFLHPVFVALAMCFFPSAGFVTAAEDDGVPRREDVHYESVTATVAMLNYETRAAALQFEDDSISQFVVGPEVERLEEIKVGDTVMIEYISALGLELREPTPEEAANPVADAEVVERAPADTMAPAGATGNTVRAVTTIEVLDRIHNTATLMAPNGHLLTIRVKDPDRLPEVRIGQTVIVTYTEAVVVSIDKVD